MLVRLQKQWKSPNIFQQTPGNSRMWDGITFTENPVEKCDYLIIFNFLSENLSTVCRKGNVWNIIQEPYIPGIFEWAKEGHSQFSKVFTPHEYDKSKKYIITQTMLPWHVKKSYDELVAIVCPKKSENVSCIASNKAFFPGHKLRLDFLNEIRKSDKGIHFYGRGINEIDDKWDALENYKYSIAIENSDSNHYWTEKLADCFLSYTMPIYFGCTNIDTYFPKNSMIKINIKDPKEALSIIKDAIENNLWEKNLDAITEARDLVLNKYQFFPAITEAINKFKNTNEDYELFKLKKYQQSLKSKILYKARGLING